MRTEEQNDLASAVRSLLAKRADSESVRAAMASDEGYDIALWTTLCEQIGVAGLDVADTAPVLEELGYSLAPTPLLASLVASEALRGTGRTVGRIEAACTPGRKVPFSTVRRRQSCSR